MLGLGLQVSSMIGAAAAAGAAAVSSTQWRLQQRRNSGDSTYTGMYEFDWLDSGGLKIDTTGATHSGSTPQAGAHANLHDGLTGAGSGFCQVTGAAAVNFDTTFLTAKAVHGVKIWPMRDAVARTPGHFDIQAFVSGAWQTVFSVAMPTWTIDVPQTFLKPTHTAAARYWRNRVTTLSGGGTLAMSEQQWRLTLGGANAALSKVAIFRAEQAGQPASNLHDGNINTFYASTNAVFYADADYAGVDMGVGQTANFAQMAMSARNDGFPNQCPASGQIQSSDDGISWLPRKTYSLPAFTTNGQTQTVDIAA